MSKLHNCFCGCQVEIYKHGMGPAVNLNINTFKYIKYGLRGKHNPNCIFYNTEMRNDFDSEEEAIKIWNNLF